MTLDPPLLELLDLASRSPSSHNAQPWAFVPSGEGRLILRSDRSRWLRMVDPANRELLLSFGALIETLRQAAPALGYGVDIEMLAERAEASDIARLHLTASAEATSTAPALIRSRATTRTPFLPAALAARDVDRLLGLDQGALHYVPREDPAGRLLVDATTEAFSQQTWDETKQSELAEWLRFSRREVRTRGDGLTPEALGLSSLARTVWYAAFTRKQALKPSFRRSSIKVTRRQLDGCAGFLVVTSADRSVGALLDAGAIYMRALLRATERGVAHHTMSYALEEDPWRDQIGPAIQIERPIQFIVRVGAAKRLSRPAVRRPASEQVQNRGDT